MCQLGSRGIINVQNMAEERLLKVLASVDAFDIELTKDTKIESGALLSSSLHSSRC